MSVDPYPRREPPTSRPARRGSFVLGVVVGLLIGLALALGVALYITKAPVPFIDKVPQRTAEQDKAEAEKNRNWDPNAPLGGRPTPRPALAGASAAGTVGALPAASAPSAVVAATPAAVVAPPVAASAPRSARDPAAILAGSASPGPTQTPPTVPTPAPAVAPVADNFVYFVQAGAYGRNEDAEQQKAKLALLGQTARISEREQSGRVVYRVRVGPFPRRDEADALQQRLTDNAIESQIVRVEKP
ncbi:MAG: SPOR domain-containing protein [Rubrivivax sp.]|jgi:cell division protein FtsN|nr:SPOR domain-containing protein [Rubrivivax sp.]